MAAILKFKMAASKHIFDGRLRILTTEGKTLNYVKTSTF